MASFTISAAPWLAGTTVSVYYVEAWPSPAQPPSGPVVTTGVVTTGGTVSFTDLAEKRRYVAYAAGRGVRFSTPVVGIQESVADRERINNLELQSSSGGGSGAFVLTWDPVTGWPDRPATTSSGFWQDLTGTASDPTTLMLDGDLFIGNAP